MASQQRAANRLPAQIRHNRTRVTTEGGGNQRKAFQQVRCFRGLGGEVGRPRLLLPAVLI